MGWGLLAFGIVLLVEGLLWAFAPTLVEEALRLLRALPADTRRLAGLAAAASGVLLITLGRFIGL